MTNRRNRNVDDAGIRLAPTPLNRGSVNVMPAVRQDYIIEPQLVVDEPSDDLKRSFSTEKDFQPKKKDISKRWKRSKRSRNLVVGIVMFIVSCLVLLPYILGAAHVFLDNFIFRYVPRQFGALNNLVEAFKATVKLGWKGEEVNAIWISMVPSLILIVGIIALVVNFIKSVMGMFGAIKPKKYMIGAIIYLFAVLAVFIMTLVGAPAVGVEKIDFVRDFIKGYKTSELFGLLIPALGYFTVACICTFIHKEKYGYLK